VYRLGTYAWFGYELPLEERLRLIKQTGFDTTCLWFGDEEEMYRDGYADRMPTLTRDTGLYLDNIHAPFDDNHFIWSEDKDSEEKILREFINTLEYCAEHQIPVMVAHLANSYSTSPPGERGLYIIRDLLSKAESLGVTIAAENTGRPEYLEYIFTNIESPSLRFCYDSGHDFVWGKPQGKLLDDWGHLLVTTHLSDNYGKTDDHLLPGKGTIDWQKVEKSFLKSKYHGALILEVEDFNAVKRLSPEEYLQAGYEWLKAWAEELELSGKSDN
jgi:sugar phosphate isomerase/epimerase